MKDRALIRELHVYGSIQRVDENSKDAMKTQHMGIGRKLLAKAEEIAFYKHYKMGTVVISGIGVRGYYEKFGYVLENHYMVKDFKKNIMETVDIIGSYVSTIILCYVIICFLIYVLK